MKFKKAQGTVSGLVILIGVLIVLYVLLLPPCDKCELLNTECPSYCEEELEDNILLSVSPGEIFYSDEITHTINSVNLFLNYEPEIKEFSDQLEVSKSWVGSLDREFNFKVEELEDLDSAYLSFIVMKSKGNLYIYLNDKQIFSGKLSPGDFETVSLPLEYLEENNKLSLYVNPPGIFFWVKNEYVLKDFELNSEFVKLHSREGRSFSFSSEEKNFLDESNLEYSVYCTSLEEEFANLKIYLNEKQISSETISCVSEDRSVELNEEDFLVGKNSLTFLIDRGNFLINDIVVVNELDREAYPSYSFDLDSKEDKTFMISLSFESEDLNILNFKINNKLISIETYDSVFERDVTSFVKVGENNIELISDQALEINELRVWYN